MLLQITFLNEVVLFLIYNLEVVSLSMGNYHHLMRIVRLYALIIMLCIMVIFILGYAFLLLPTALLLIFLTSVSLIFKGIHFNYYYCCCVFSFSFLILILILVAILPIIALLAFLLLQFWLLTINCFNLFSFSSLIQTLTLFFLLIFTPSKICLLQLSFSTSSSSTSILLNYYLYLFMYSLSFYLIFYQVLAIITVVVALWWLFSITLF